MKFKKEVSNVDAIKNALQGLAEAVKSNETTTRITVTITFKKPKPDKATKDDE